MSRDATRWAWSQTKVRGTTKLVLLALAERANHAGIAFPSVARLEADTGLYRETISRAITELESAGLIRTAREAGKRGRFGGNVYQMVGMDAGSTAAANAAMDAGSTAAANTAMAQTGVATGGCNSNPLKQKAARAQHGDLLGDSADVTIAAFTAAANAATNQKQEQKQKQKQEQKQRTANAARSTGPLPDLDLPEWLPLGAWDAWLAMRRANRIGNSAAALQAAIERLAELRAAGHAPEAVLKHNTVAEYRALFPPPVDRGTPSEGSATVMGDSDMSGQDLLAGLDFGQIKAGGTGP